MEAPVQSKEEQNISPNDILIVEDDVLLRMALAEELRAAEFNVLEARDGDEALKILESRKTVGLVIADADLPGRIDGVALDDWLRRAIPDVKLILVSRYETTRRGNAGFAKPYNVHALVRSAKELLPGPPTENFSWKRTRHWLSR
jgi:DNA-binding response OmpR family regulator